MFSLTSSPRNRLVFDGDTRLPQNCVPRLHLSALATPRTEDQHPCIEDNVITANALSFSTSQYPMHTTQLGDPGTIGFAHTHKQLPHDVRLWSLFNQPLVSESVMPSMSTVVNENHGSHMNSTSNYFAYDAGDNDTHLDGHEICSASSILWPASHSSRQPLSSFVSQEICDPGAHFHSDTSLHPSVARLFHEVPLHYPTLSDNQAAAELSDFSHVLQHRSFGPPSSHWGADLEPDPRSHFPVYRQLLRDFTIPSRRRGAARSIEYDGLWVDEAELLKGLAEPDGKIWVVQCCWEQDHSPCHLWIKGDRSSINTHIQKWHGGKPGGDKFQAGCRWAGCGKTMLKESIARHIIGIHLGEVWECQGCGKEIVRNDAYGRHSMKSKATACQTLDALITYSVDARVINARAALDSGGRLRYAGSWA